jgi:Leucine Rich repeat
LHLDELSLRANCITDVGVEFLFYQLRNAPDVRIHEIKSINLSGNDIGDYGALYITESFKSARYPHLKSLDLSNNNITDTGAAYLADSLKSPGSKLKVLHLEGNKLTSAGNDILINALTNPAVQDVIITMINLYKEYHLSPFGNKEAKIAILKDNLLRAKAQGVDVKNIVVDRSFFGHVKNEFKLVKQEVWGFTKCYVSYDDVQSFAADRIIAKASKKASIVSAVKDAIFCYFEAVDEARLSEVGVESMKYDLIGLDEYIDGTQ